MPVNHQLRYWSIAALLLAAALWYLGNVLLPFVVGGAIAYFVDPVADRLERAGLSRVAATALITVAALIVFVLLALLVIPTLVSQAIDLVELAPQLTRDLQAFLTDKFPSLLTEGSPLRETLIVIGETVRSKGGALLNTLLSSALSLIDVIIFLVVVPVVAIYMLLDWDRMIARIDDLLPREHAPVIRQLASEIDDTLSSFIRGVGMVSVTLGTYYAVSLMLVGLNFGLVVGFVAGLVTFIPYLGALIGGSLGIGLALFQFWGDWGSIGMVAGIFVVGQVVEGNILTPRLVGHSVGLHPVWLLLALSVFGALFGFIGMLVAVPVAASLGVLARYGTAQYMKSGLYKGNDKLDDHRDAP